MSFKTGLICIFCFILTPDLWADTITPHPEERKNADYDSVISEAARDKFIESLKSVARETGKPWNRIEKDVLSVLDQRLPGIDRNCELATSHHILLLAYAVRAQIPGSFKALRELAVAFVDSSTQFREVSSQCRGELRALGVALVRSWGVEIDDTSRGKPAPEPGRKDSFLDQDGA